MATTSSADTLFKGNTYKIYELPAQGGKLLYSAAQFNGSDGVKGNKFTLVTRSEGQYIWIKPENMKNYVFSQTAYSGPPAKAKTKKK